MKTCRMLVCRPIVLLLVALLAGKACAHFHRIKKNHMTKDESRPRRQDGSHHQHQRSLGAGTSNFGSWHEHGAGRKCGTHEPSAGAVESSNRLAHHWLASKGGRALQDLDPIVLPVCFHVIRPEGDTATGFLNTASLQEQLDALNLSFTSQSCCDTNQFWCNGECSIDTGMRFEMAVLSDGSYESGSATTSNVADVNTCVTRTNDDNWYFADSFSETEEDMKRTLRVGDASVLNIYFKPSSLLGYATFPHDFVREGDVDGVVINDEAIVGGVSDDYNEGDTLSHEVGHWIGLYHTFQGACQIGDEVLDTSPEKTPAFGCVEVIGRDTCPGDDIDPVHNYMDYSYDVCLYTWTEGQMIRARSQIETYRLGNGPREDIALTDGVPAATIASLFAGESQGYFLEGVAPNTRVTCTTTSTDTGGDADLFVRIGARPDMVLNTFDCVSETAFSDETCAVLTPDGAAVTVHVIVFAFKATASVTLTCSTSPFTSTTQLSDGIPSDPISLAAGELQVFSLAVESEGARVTCELEGADGDLDLFMDVEEPYLGSGVTDCASTGAFSVESCAIESASQNLFVTVQAFADATNAVLTCFVAAGQGATIALTDDVESDPISVAAFGAQKYTLEVAPETTRVTCAAAADGLGSMYLRWGLEPNIFTFDYDCFDADFSRPCEVTDPGSETVLHVLVVSEAGLDSLTVRCTSASTEPTLLADGIPSEAVFLSSIQNQIYTLPVLRGANITCETSASDGDLDLYIGFDQPVDVFSSFEECGTSESSTETCSLVDPGDAEFLYVTLVPYGGPVSDAVVTCTSTFSGTVIEPGTVVELVDGVPSAPFSLETGQSQSFSLSVSPDSSVVCETIGDGSGGDPDLYLQWGSEPDLESFIYDCASASDGSGEICTVTNPGGATVLWALVNAYVSFSGLTIQCSSFIPELPNTLDSGVPSAEFSLVPFETKTFTLSVTPGERTTCATTAFTLADIDLYLRLDAEPDVEGGNYDCFSEFEGSDEVCFVRNTGGADTLWATIVAVGDTTTQGISITCFSEFPPAPTTLIDGVSFGPFSMVELQFDSFNLAIQPGDVVTCETTAASGDLDLFLRWDAEPNYSFYECASVSLAADETCEARDPGDASVLWVLLIAWSTVVDATITCSMFVPEEPLPTLTLEDGVPSVPFSLSAFREQSFIFSFIERRTTVTCVTSGGADGDADLYLRLDAFPDIENGVYDCIGFGSTSEETCSVEDQGFATAVYGTIIPYSGTSVSDVTVTCTTSSPLSVISLSNGIASEPFGLPAGMSQTFLLNVTDITGSVLICQTQGDVGDADLYSRFGSKPDLDLREYGYDCESSGGTSYEECVVDVLEDATSLYVTVSAFTTFSDLTLTCSAYSLAVLGAPGESSAVSLLDGVPSDPFNLNLGQFQTFKLDLSILSGSVTCTVTATGGDADLYLRLNAEPVLDGRGLYDCASETFTSNETCVTAITSDTTSVYARVDAFAAFNNGITTCTSSTSVLATPSPVIPAPTPSSSPVPESGTPALDTNLTTPAPDANLTTPAPDANLTTPAPTPQSGALGSGGLPTNAPNNTDSLTAAESIGQSGGVSVHASGSAVSGVLIGMVVLAVAL